MALPATFSSISPICLYNSFGDRADVSAKVVAQLKANIEKHIKLRILEEICSFTGIDPIALWKDIINCLRIAVEHVNRRLKIFKILSYPYRNRHRRFGSRASLIAGIYNYELAA